VQKCLRRKVCNVLTVPVILHGNEIWTFRQKDKKSLTAVDMKFFRRIARYTLFDHKMNEEILEGLKVEPVEEKEKRYKSAWLQHVTRMNNHRIPKLMLNFKPNVRRRRGRLLNRLLDEAETGLLRPNS
jgi:hypothetical protein